MELKVGYKLTEVGMIPEDWEVTEFENIADKNKKWSITGGPFGSNLKTTDYTDDGIQIIQLQNIGDGKFINESQVFTSEEKANELLSCNIYPGDIILSKMGDPVTRACFIPNISDRLLMASDGIRLVVNEKCFSKKFIHDYINSIYFRKRAIEISTGTTRQRIGLPELKRLLVIKPSLKEQTAIATALSDADAWITSLEQLIAKKRLLKQAAMQELLKPKEGWEVKKLGDVCDVIIGLTYSPNDVRDHGTLVLRSSNIQNNKLAFENNVFVEMDLPQRVIVKENDILVCVRNGSKQLIGKCALIDKKNEGHAFGAFMSIIRSEYNKYIYYYFLSNHIQIQIDENMGATINQLTNATLKSFEIYLPKSKDEQTSIATILSDMDSELTALENKLEKAKKIKLGMMQELLTGKIRFL